MRTSLALLALLLPSALAAQLAPGGDMANFGSRMVSPGFTPDPMEISVVSGGSVDISSLDIGIGCVGYATEQPDYILNLSDASTQLSIFFEGDGDTGLVINAPDGTWHCNDDAVGLDPMVTFDGARSGQYDIWVASYSSSESISGTLSITELDYGPGGASMEDLVIGGDQGTFGRTSLSPGFSPDPYTVSVTSGGSVDTSLVDDLPFACTGYVTSQPDFILDYASGGTLLHVYVEGDGDTALIINGPDGSWHCNDDTNGVDPRVTFKAPQAGQYDIWVASFFSGESISGTLGITELDPPGGK